LYSPVFSSKIIHIATHATGALIGTQACIRLIVEPQILAIEDEPLQVVISETTLIVYGNSSTLGKTGINALSANAP
jgi:hypothetical protein